jgi:DUF4097 and DUF4098 domain-containing protein YvlB
MRLILPVLAALILAGCDPEDFGPSDRYKADFHYTLKPSGRLSVENFNGEIEIAGWDEPSIEVTGVRYASTQEVLNSIRIDIRESPALTEIRTEHPSAFHGSQGARYLIRAPRKTALDRIVSSNGAIRIHDMTSDSRLHTSNGAVRAENIAGSVEAETSNGAIDLDSVTGKLNLKTTNGRIRAEDVAGPCEAETSNGPVALHFKDAPDGPTRIRTSNGSVEVAMSKSPKSGIRADTSNGPITLDLPGNTAARVNAETSQSSISSDFEVSTGFSSGEKEKHHLEGNIGAGGPLIELTTHNGSIHIRKSTATAN